MAKMTKNTEFSAWDVALMAAQRGFANALLGALIVRGVFSHDDAHAVLMVTAEHLRQPGEGLRIEPQAYVLAQMFVDLAGQIIAASREPDGAGSPS